MVTPYDNSGEIDYDGLGKFIKFLEAGGADGLFAVCQSSEMFFLNPVEKIRLAEFVKKESSLDVIASGHTQTGHVEQLEAMKAMEQTGVDAVVLLSNAFNTEDEDDDALLNRLDWFLNNFNSTIPLGIYECPYPYKRLLSDRVFKYIVNTGRFRIMKDTSCRADIMESRLKIIGEANFGLYNANAETIAWSSLHGAAGYSGVHANISPFLVKYVMDNPIPGSIFEARAHGLLYELSKFMASGHYPAIAKVMLKQMGIFKNCSSRAMDSSLITASEIETAKIFTERINEFERAVK